MHVASVFPNKGMSLAGRMMTLTEDLWDHALLGSCSFYRFHVYAFYHNAEEIEDTYLKTLSLSSS